MGLFSKSLIMSQKSFLLLQKLMWSVQSNACIFNFFQLQHPQKNSRKSLTFLKVFNSLIRS